MFIYFVNQSVISFSFKVWRSFEDPYRTIDSAKICYLEWNFLVIKFVTLGIWLLCLAHRTFYQDHEEELFHLLQIRYYHCRFGIALHLKSLDHWKLADRFWKMQSLQLYCFVVEYIIKVFFEYLYIAYLSLLRRFLNSSLFQIPNHLNLTDIADL